MNTEPSLTSIGGSTVTYQLLKVIRETKGDVKVVNMEDALVGKSTLMRAGIFAENSSAVILKAITLLEHELSESDLVIAILTSHGFKGL